MNDQHPDNVTSELQDPRPRERGQIPAWISAVIVLLCIAGGVAFLVWQMRGGGSVTETVMLSNPVDAGASARAERAARPERRTDGQRNAGRRGVLVDAAAPDGVHAGPRQSMVVKSGKTAIQVSQNNGEPVFYGYYFNLPTPAGSTELMQIRGAVLNDPTWAKTLGVSSAQLEKLRGASRGPGMVLDDADVSRLRELWKAWDLATDKSGAEKAIVAAVAEVGEKNRGATQQAMEERIAAIRAVFTPEQLAKYRSSGADTAKPATRPSAKTPPSRPTP